MLEVYSSCGLQFLSRHKRQRRLCAFLDFLVMFKVVPNSSCLTPGLPLTGLPGVMDVFSIQRVVL